MTTLQSILDSYDGPFDLVGDFEADSLDPTKVHVAAFRSYPYGDWFLFEQEECYGDEIRLLLKRCRKLIGHNFVSFDLRLIIHRFIDKTFPLSKIYDTYIISKMMLFDRPGGHGLESWGEYFGVPKPPITDWTVFTPEMVHRVKQDVEINCRLYEKILREFKSSDKSVKLEHEVQWYLDDMRAYGFWFDLPRADEIYSKVCVEEEKLVRQLREDFGKQSIPTAVTRLRYKKVTRKFVDETGQPIRVRNEKGRLVNKTETVMEKTILTKKKIPLDNVWGDFSPIEWGEFNPGSPQQVKEKLENCGWNPTVFRKPTKIMLSKGITRGAPIISDEENLKTIPDNAPDSIKKIGHYLIVRNRKLRMEEWFGSLQKDQRMHGRIQGIGARTHRCSHAVPNMANVPSASGYLGQDYRGVWGVPPVSIIKKGIYDDIYKTRDERRLIGCDAAGIQLRILCHYLDDPEYTRQVVSGDIHSYNMFAAGIDPKNAKIKEEKILKLFGRMPSIEEALENRWGKEEGFEWQGREVSKTFIYAYLLGAGNPKLFSITGIPGQDLKNRFYEEIPALRELQEVKVPKMLKAGFVTGIDGRVFPLDEVPKHKVLSILLQEGEAVVMKVALRTIVRTIKQNNYDAFPVAFVHDEFQIDSALHCTEEMKTLAIDSIVTAGEKLGLLCPLAAEARVGTNWFSTH